MSNIKFYYNNHVDNATLTASTAEAFYPVTNLKDVRSTKVWRSTTNSDNVVFDLGSAKAVDSILLRGSLLNPNFHASSVTIEAHTSDSWGAPSFSTTLTFNTAFNFGLKTLSATETYRYWRLVFTTAGSFVETSNVYIGEFTQLANNNIDYGWSNSQNDLSKITTNRYGQKFIDKTILQKEFSMSIAAMTISEMEIIANMFNAVGKNKEFWVVVDEQENIVTDLERFSMLGHLSKSPKFNNANPFLYNTNFTVIEAT